MALTQGERKARWQQERLVKKLEENEYHETETRRPILRRGSPVMTTSLQRSSEGKFRDNLTLVPDVNSFTVHKRDLLP